MINHKWKNIDRVLLLICLGITCVGLCTIGSATHINKGMAYFDFFIKQAVAFLINLFIILFGCRYDYTALKRWIKPLYILNLLMLGGVLFLGKSALGAQRWIQLGPITLQPSEFSKLIMIVCTASMLSERVQQLNTVRQILPIAVFVGVPFLLVLKQPDLGTSLVFIGITLGMLFMAQIRLRLLGKIALLGVVLAPVGWHFLKDYQKSRIAVFLDPNADPFGAGYHIIQSKIAIGSGMFFGKGLFQGTQSQLNFLPENHTDFIFSVIGEELGFIGCFIVLLLYFMLVYRGLLIAKECKEPFGMLVATGIISMWVFQVLVNVGMTCGIMPVTGIPLPFMSYGVSSLTTNMLALGILLSIHFRQQKMIFNL
ncbi:rod shape-determining protein RodA [uncultured Megasphaera sp.]|uniref:rod shape-determining protein RodA n=1 Tax=uncultured Megasphaera sp. TaxID=165188 RepID=UPI002598A3A3|nr:rod shape-determining protein RodA [uncultured Megasphaera sp.]